jgi:hypothetical protein
MIYLITPTGGRPGQFDICVRLMQQQTYPGDVTWIIVDDCIPTTTDIVKDDFRKNWHIIKTYPTPEWTPGQNTQFRNMLAGIKTLEENAQGKNIEAIFIIEDDDYYKPTYLHEMTRRIGTFDIIGETNTIYYNVRFRKHLPMQNYQHSSLFQTAISIRAVRVLKNACNRPIDGNSFFIDINIWREIQNKLLFNGGNVAIGIKGMPGRFGLGGGHDDKWGQPDMSMNYLRSLIGEDANLYSDYLDPQYVHISKKEERRSLKRKRRPIRVFKR